MPGASRRKVRCTHQQQARVCRAQMQSMSHLGVTHLAQGRNISCAWVQRSAVQHRAGRQCGARCVAPRRRVCRTQARRLSQDLAPGCNCRHCSARLGGSVARGVCCACVTCTAPGPGAAQGAVHLGATAGVS